MSLSDPIVVSLDLEQRYEHVLDEARRLAAGTGAELTLLNAVPVATMPQFGDDTLGDRDRAERRCRELAADLHASGVRVSRDPVVRVEGPAELILQVARERKVSCVVVGDGGESALDRLLLGSIVERVLTESPRPVWVVHPRKTPELDSLLVAVDTSRVAGEALQLALALARALGASLKVMRVFPDSESRATAYAKQRDELQRYTDAFDVSGVDIEILAWEGDPGARILEAASAVKPAVLVLGSAGRRGIYRWIRRPMSERVVRQLPCSLLSVPPTPGRG